MIERTIDQYTPGDFIEDWDLDGLFTALGQFFPLDLDEPTISTARRSIATSLTERIVELGDRALRRARSRSSGEELMGALERFLLLQIIDERWREHLFDMDYLREGIHLRGFAQIDPLVAYKNEAFTLFGDLMNSVWTDYARMIFNVQVNVEGENGAGAPAPLPAFTAGRQLDARRARLLLGRPQRGRRRRARRRRGRGGRWRRSRVRATGRSSKRCRSSSSACSTTSTRSGATTRAGAAAARSSRSATAPERSAAQATHSSVGGRWWRCASATSCCCSTSRS